MAKQKEAMILNKCIQQNYIANLDCSFWNCYMRKKKNIYILKSLFSEILLHDFGPILMNLITSGVVTKYKLLGQKSQKLGL